MPIFSNHPDLTSQIYRSTIRVSLNDMSKTMASIFVIYAHGAAPGDVSAIITSKPLGE
jgi:hypothetical protein